MRNYFYYCYYFYFLILCSFCAQIHLQKFSQSIQLLSSHSIRHLGSTGSCSFHFTPDYDYTGTRYPRVLAKAVCHDMRCEPIMYNHQVLVKSCDSVWKWKETSLPVAYVLKSTLGRCLQSKVYA